jgi:hypothetical protein
MQLKTGKDLKCPPPALPPRCARFSAGNSFHLKKMGVSDAWRINLIFMQKPNRTLLYESSFRKNFRFNK